MVWRVIGYDSDKEILRQEIPLDQADERRISEILRSLAAQHLNSEEIAAGLADVQRDTRFGSRIIFTAGLNPHYVASLWRSDELANEKGVKGR
jgi:hypothetical protein